MRDRKIPLIVSLGLMLALSFASTASATLLANGTSGPPSPTNSPLGAVLQADSGAVGFVAVDATSFSGTLRTRVYSNDPFNPLGGLTFTFLITNNGPDPIEQLSTINFTGFQTDVTFNNVPANLGVIGSVPFIVTRNATGKILGWQFDPTGPSLLGAGMTSTLLVAHTNATAFVQVQDSLINGSVAVANSFGPAVPEAASIGFVGIGLATMAIRRRTTR